MEKFLIKNNNFFWWFEKHGGIKIVMKSPKKIIRSY